MKTVTLEIPDAVDEQEIRMQVAGFLFERGILSAGQAADMVGINKVEFLETAGRYRISIFGETPEDIANL